MSRRAPFITLEGGEGAGKSTQIACLAKTLAIPGREILQTREPGGSAGAEAIRRLLVEGEPQRWDPLTEAMLFCAARRDHVHRTIRPALARGAWVLCDRFSDSTTAYQGMSLGADPERLAALIEMATDGLWPDLTIILDLPVDAGLARAAGRSGGETRYERMDRAVHERLRASFLAIAVAAPHRCLVIDAARPIDAVAADVSAAVIARFGPP
jgi:dTMP kinase